MEKIRVGILGLEWAVKIETQTNKNGSMCTGWRVMERYFKSREDANCRLRELIATGKYQEG